MESRILLLTAGPTGTEAIKNLVLPGCGHITIVDDAIVTERDCANNFFVSREHVGKPRAQVRARPACGGAGPMQKACYRRDAAGDAGAAPRNER